MAHHDLNIMPEYFAAVANGTKLFEIRYNDRDYHVEDTLRLRERDGALSGRYIDVRVTYLTDYAQQDRYVVMGIRPMGGVTYSDRSEVPHG